LNKVIGIKNGKIEDKCLLDIHEGGHILHGVPAFDWIDKILI